jgi:hypothetical protein
VHRLGNPVIPRQNLSFVVDADFHTAEVVVHIKSAAVESYPQVFHTVKNGVWAMSEARVKLRLGNASRAVHGIPLDTRGMHR